MTPVLLLAFALAILVAGGAVLWYFSRHRRYPVPPDESVTEMGYGRQRWERELALWKGTLRRLEIQAKHRSPVPDGLQRQIDEARERIAEAERRLQ